MQAADWASTITPATFDAAGAQGGKEVRAAVESALGDFEGRLLIEPGRFLVAQAGALVARVLHVKRNGKKTFVITDAAMNDLIRPALYQAHHEIVPVRPGQGSRASSMWWVRSANRATFLRTTGSWRRWSRAIWLHCSMPAPTAWRKARTTIRVLRPAEVLVEGRRRG